ncbi:hypothetical protein V8C86DRAFT_1783980 [Haematococcus lacustris]
MPRPFLMHAGPQGPQTLQDLKARLRGGMARVDARVVQDLIRFCAPQLPYADDQLLLQLYQYVAATPHTSTKVRFQRSDGLVFNGPYSSGMPARAILLIAFQNHTQPLLAKFTLDPTDIEHEHRVLSELADGTRTFSLRLQLQHVPCPMDTACLLRCGQQLKNTLDCIHDKGYGHNDIKAANVFLDSKGDCILGDFGAAQSLGMVAKEGTNTHWPADVTETSTAADFFMLAVMLLERAGVHELCRDPTLATIRASAERLAAALPSGATQSQSPQLQLYAFVLELIEACSLH